jgi:hypothetical protein
MTYAINSLLFYSLLPRFVAALKPFGCAATRDPSTGERILIYTSEVKCGSKEHVLLMMFGTVSAVLYGVLPARYFFRKLKEKQDKLEDEEIMNRYGFLYEGLSRDCVHWEITYQWAYRVLTAVLELRFVPPSIQAFCLLVLDLVMLGVILKKTSRGSLRSAPPKETAVRSHRVDRGGYPLLLWSLG